MAKARGSDLDQHLADPGGVRLTVSIRIGRQTANGCGRPC
jgi:hypothetical protein